MAMTMDIKAKVDELAPDVLSEGDMDYPRMTNIGQLFTAGWQERLILAGKVHKVIVGTLTTGTAPSLVGTGTVVDLEMPHICVAADSGILIPMSIMWSGIADSDAENDQVDVFLTSDRATAVLGGANRTNEIPINVLDGGPTFNGRCFSVTTGAVADPVHSDLFYYRVWEALGADGKDWMNYHVEKTFQYPTFVRGPCSLLLYTGGTQALTQMGAFTFAHIPASWVPVS